jgi:hypothetical protein
MRQPFLLADEYNLNEQLTGKLYETKKKYRTNR